MRKRVFISGGAGVIGTALVEKLLVADVDLLIGDLKPCPKEWVGKLKYWQGDLNTITSDELMDFNPEVFFHLAATFERSEETFPFFEDNFHHNVHLSHHLMNCLKNSQTLTQVVFASSYLIYDPNLYLSNQNHPPVVLNENTFLSPRNICGAAKFFHELELRFLNLFVKVQIHIACVRIFRVYGKGAKDTLSRWVRSALNNKTLQVYRPEGQFDFIYAEDVAEGLLKLAEKNFRGVINLGKGQARSIKEALSILKGHFPNLTWTEVETSIPFESSQADMRLFFETTQWSPQHTLEKGVAKLIEYEKNRVEETNVFSDSKNGVLVTSISKKVPLLQAVKKASMKLGHYKIISGCDSDSKCIGQYFVDEFWHCPRLDLMDVEDLITYCHDHQIKAIIPTRNGDLKYFSKHCDLFNQNGIHVLVSSFEALTNCLDKKKFADVLTRQDLPVIPTFLSLDELKGELFVVKDRFGAGSQKIGLRLNKENSIEMSKQLKNPIFQPFIEGVEWSVDIYRGIGGKIAGSVARKRDLVIEGESQITTTASHPRLEKLCHTIVHYLNLYGPAVLQVIEDSNGSFHVIECNPRFGGASTASLAVGWDPFYWFFLDSLGENLEKYPFYRKNNQVRQVRYLTDKILPWS